MPTISSNPLLVSSGSTTIDTVDSDTVAKAWINFNGTGTISIRDSYNISGISDNGTGDYTIDFATALPSSDYAFIGGNALESSTDLTNIGPDLNNPTKTTSALRICAKRGGQTKQDCDHISLVIFGS
jgi:hypothetical protein